MQQKGHVDIQPLIACPIIRPYTQAVIVQPAMTAVSPNLRDIHLSQAPVMTWNDGHRWTLTTFLPPGTYPFKLVVAGKA
jgi:hypothetical protein